jgi:hypothetical protein
VQAGDPRADPAIVDLIELAGLWLGANDRAALKRTLRQLVDQLAMRYPTEGEYRQRFSALVASIEQDCETEQLRRDYRRATLG